MKPVFEKKDKFNFIAKHIKNFRGYPPMFHSHGELLCVVDGEIPMIVDGREHTLKAGEISVVFPYVVHSYENAPDAELYMIMFDPASAELFESDLLSKKPLYPFIAKSDGLLPFFKKAAELMKEDDAVSQKTAISYISVILGELLGSMPLCEVEALSENMTKSILAYCSEHFADDDISIKKTADALYISVSYVSKVFSRKFKYGFREYINELRISKAKKLLADTDMKIVDIMFECGFKNQSSFNRIFGENCGYSPSAYRAKHK